MIVVNENDKTGISAECLESHGPGSGKKIENSRPMDGFTKDTEQGFPRPIRCWSDTLVLRRWGKEFSAFFCTADNSQKSTVPKGG